MRRRLALWLLRSEDRLHLLRVEFDEREAAARAMATASRPGKVRVGNADVPVSHETNRRTRVFWDGYAHGVKAMWDNPRGVL